MVIILKTKQKYGILIAFQQTNMHLFLIKQQKND